MTNYYRADEEPWEEARRLRGEVVDLRAKLAATQKPLRALQRRALTQTVWGWRDLWKAATEALGEPSDDAALIAAVHAYEEEQKQAEDQARDGSRAYLAGRERRMDR